MIENDKCPFCGFDLGFQWSWTKFAIGKLSNKFLAWVFSSILVWAAMFTGIVNGDHTTVVIIVWGTLSVIFMLAGAIDTAVKNAQIKLELKGGASVHKEIKTPGGN